MAEFTGERVIPGEVNVDLLNEHVARYIFAARLARGKRVLDAGCGAGYGSAELAHSAQFVVGADLAPEAVGYARAHYRMPNLAFEQASCVALPHADAGFDLVVAFEVIEHLENWRELLREAHRLLAADGQFVVSTPNKLYYSESRGPEGTNPFHEHEFTFEEFRGELASVFPHVSLFLENHVEGVAFQPHEAGQAVEVRVDAGEPAPDESHFFVAVCAHRPQPASPVFVYVPRAANLLRERERHIALLDRELATKNEWLEKARHDLAQLDRAHRELNEELRRSNRWAEQLNQQVGTLGARVEEVQDELVREQEKARQMAEAYEVKIAELEQDVRDKAQWARDTDARLQQHIQDLVAAVEALHGTEKELEERTAWALRLRDEAGELAQQLALYRASRWVKLGRKVGLGPTSPAG